MSKVAIVGCGAMGSVYAALMVSAGHEVHGSRSGSITPRQWRRRACGSRAPAATAQCNLLVLVRPQMESAFATSSSLPRRHSTSRRRPAPVCH